MNTTVKIITPEDTRASRISGQIYRQLENFAQTHTPSWVFPPETGFRCFANDPHSVRKPHTALISLQRFSRQEYEKPGFIEVIPDLVAEVVSPNDKAQDVAIRIVEWLAAGVKVVWEVYPKSQVIRSYRLDFAGIVLRIPDTLTAPELLPGFACPVAELFRLPGEPTPSA